MDRICCIMDVDGFSPRVWSSDKLSYQTVFLVRELGYVRLDPTSEHRSQPKSFRFDLRDQIDHESIRNSEATLEHQCKRVTGLSLFPGPRETGVLPYSQLQDVVQQMYRECRREGAPLVAYKGGEHERRLLDSCEIESVDLQLFGCPTYKRLVGSGKVWDCGFHRLTSVSPVHCPMAEVAAYRDWCVLNFRRFES